MEGDLYVDAMNLNDLYWVEGFLWPSPPSGTIFRCLVAVGQQTGRAAVCVTPRSVNIPPTSVKVATMHSQCILEERRWTLKHYV